MSKIGKAFQKRLWNRREGEENTRLSRLEHENPERALVEYAGLGDTAAVQRMLSAGTDPNARVSFDITVDTITETALCAVASNGRAETVSALIVGGADPDLSDDDGFTPLMGAAMNDHADAVTALAEGGASLDGRDARDGFTALHRAARLGHSDAVRALLEAGADPAVKDHFGLRAQDMACDQSGLAADDKTRRHGEILDIFFSVEKARRDKAAAERAARERALDNIAVLQKDVTPLKPLRPRRKSSPPPRR